MSLSLELRKNEHLTDSCSHFVRIGIEVVHSGVAHYGVARPATNTLLLKPEQRGESWGGGGGGGEE